MGREERQPGGQQRGVNAAPLVASDAVRFLSALVVYTLLSWCARWVPSDTRLWVQIAAVTTPVILTWHLAQFPVDQQPLQLTRQGWLNVATLLSLTGIVLALLHLREGRIPEVASTLFLTVVSSGLMMWAVLRKPT